MHNRIGEVRKDLMDLGGAIIAADSLTNLISGGRTFMRLDVPKAQYRCWDGRKWVSRSVSNYANSWTGGLDWRDHEIVAPQGTFTLSKASEPGPGREIFARLQQYLSVNGFNVKISPDNTRLTFKSNHPARALYIAKYPHTNGTDLDIYDFQDRLKFISVFHQELPLYQQGPMMDGIVPFPDRQQLHVPCGNLESLPAEYKTLLTSDNAMAALRDNLVTLAQVAAMPTIQHVKRLFTKDELQSGQTVDVVAAQLPADMITPKLSAATRVTISVQQMAMSIFGRKRPEGHDDVCESFSPTHRP